mmetsp:Transcript_75726/g.195137  ORF Transcript_75726/g.195137 Transcript_75726/m.195137 type:complete len:246 (-) Transcript_75726:82-819(-)
MAIEDRVEHARGGLAQHADRHLHLLHSKVLAVVLRGPLLGGEACQQLLDEVHLDGRVRLTTVALLFLVGVLVLRVARARALGRWTVLLVLLVSASRRQAHVRGTAAPIVSGVQLEVDLPPGRHGGEVEALQVDDLLLVHEDVTLDARLGRLVPGRRDEAEAFQGVEPSHRALVAAGIRLTLGRNLHQQAICGGKLELARARVEIGLVLRIVQPLATLVCPPSVSRLHVAISREGRRLRRLALLRA